MEYQYRIKELREWQKDSLFVVQKRVYFSNVIYNFLHGCDWHYLDNKGEYQVSTGAINFTSKSEAEQFIKWCKLDD